MNLQFREHQATSKQRKEPSTMNATASRFAFAVSALMAVAVQVRAAPPSQPSLIGTSVHGTLITQKGGTDVWLDMTATIRPGVEFVHNAFGNSTLSADFGGSSLTLSSFSGLSGGLGAHWVWTFDLPPGLEFTSITETSDTFTSGAELISLSDGTATFVLLDQINQDNTTYTATYDLGIREVVTCLKPNALSSTLRAAFGR